MEINETLLRALSEVNGIAGNEGAVRQLFKEETAPYAQGYVQDGLGGLFAEHIGDASGPRIMMAAHFDEVGFMVSQITDKVCADWWLVEPGSFGPASDHYDARRQNLPWCDGL